MKKVILSLILVGCSLSAQQPAFMFNQEDKLELVVNNQILAKVNGKPISVIDIMKKMDLLFYRRFPQYTSSKASPSSRATS